MGSKLQLQQFEMHSMRQEIEIVTYKLLLDL